MRFVKPSYEVIDLPDATDKMGVYKHLERIGRVCYKSEERITDDSAVKYLEMLRGRKHWAMLEHYIFVMSVPRYIYSDFINLLKDNEYDPELAHKMDYIHATHNEEIDSRYEYLISGSATAFNYLWGCKLFQNYSKSKGVVQLLMFMHNNFDAIINHPYGSWDELHRVGLSFDHSVYNEIHLLTRKEIEALPNDLRLTHDSMSVKFTVNRGVTHELVRHRPASWAQESTRYVNYGKRGCTFIVPVWLPEHDKRILLSDDCLNEITDGVFMYQDTKERYGLSDATINYLLGIKGGAVTYERLLSEYGWLPQQARSVLPNDTKAEIVMTANLLEWRHFFDMRAEGHAHVQMREVVCPLLDKVGNDVLDVRGTIFSDQRDKYIDADNAVGRVS